MCRLFGLSASPHRTHASFWLLDAPDSLVEQSHENPDGTGLGFFDADGRPVLDKEPLSAFADADFAREARHITSATFVSHIRFATTGKRKVENTHPFAMDGRVFAHNGVLGGLDELEQRARDGMRLVHGDTDSERYFALLTREIRAQGDVVAGIAAAVDWIADNLPIWAINFVLASETELWAFRYPETCGLFVLERAAGAGESGGEPEHASSTFRVHTPQLADRPAVVVASEPLDGSAGWRSLACGELVHVSPDLHVTSHLIVDRPPADPIGTDPATGLPIS